MDVEVVDHNLQRKRISFLTWEQSEAYGGYVEAARVLGADYILHPINVSQSCPELAGTFVSMVGHA